LREGTTSRVMAAERPYGEFYDFYTTSPEYFGYALVYDTIFGKKLLNLKCVLWFCLRLVSNISYSKKKWADIIVRTCSYEYPLSLSDFNQTWIVQTDFRQILKFRSNENTSRWGRFVPYGRTDMTKVIVAFRRFANAPKHFFPKYFHCTVYNHNLIWH
jgi:hypothetical protein